MAVRINKWMAALVFGGLGGLCYVSVWILIRYDFAAGGSLLDTPRLLQMTVSGAIAMALTGWCVMSWFHYKHVKRAMILGAFSALISHLPFSMFATIGEFMIEGWPARSGLIIENFLLILAAGLPLAIPLIVFGTISGAISYNLSRQPSHTNG